MAGDDAVDYAVASTDFRRYLPLKFVTFVWFVAVLAITVYATAATWLEWWPYTVLDIEDLDDVKPVIYSFIAGVIGATMFALRGFYWAVGPQDRTNKKYQYDPNWTWWYVSRPLVGGFLAAFTFALLQAGVATLGETETDDTASTAYFGIGFLAGFSATDVFNWLGDASKARFGKKDPPPD